MPLHIWAQHQDYELTFGYSPFYPRPMIMNRHSWSLGPTLDESPVRSRGFRSFIRSRSPRAPLLPPRLGIRRSRLVGTVAGDNFPSIPWASRSRRESAKHHTAFAGKRSMILICRWLRDFPFASQKPISNSGLPSSLAPPPARRGGRSPKISLNPKILPQAMIAAELVEPVEFLST